MKKKLVTEATVDAAVEMLCRRWHKCQIKAALRRGNCDKKKGPIFNPLKSARTIERVLGRARDMIRGSLSETVKDRVSTALSFYESIIRDENASRREKMAAQERIDKLLGLEHHVDLTPADEKGEQAFDTSRLSTNDIRQLDRMRRQLAPSGN